ncbi:MAG: hypothetical protein AAGI11_14400 [Pseudomonadota bacterium]
MFKSIIATVGVAISFALAPTVVSAGEAESAAATAKVIFYRADEMSRTRQINFETYAAGKPVGRLQYRKAVVAEVPAGAVKFNTSLPETATLEIDAKPGQTYYVYTGLERKGQNFVTTLEVVEEQVALSQSPALDGVI